MKPHIYFRAALFIPLILWILASITGLILSKFDGLPKILGAFLLPFVFYTIGIFLWFLPYMTLTISLWIWSKNKSIPALRNAGLVAPPLFFVLIFIEVSLIYTFTGSFSEFIQNLAELSTFLMVLSIVFGYICVGIAFGFFKALQAKTKIVHEVSLEG